MGFWTEPFTCTYIKWSMLFPLWQFKWNDLLIYLTSVRICTNFAHIKCSVETSIFYIDFVTCYSIQATYKSKLNANKWIFTTIKLYYVTYYYYTLKLLYTLYITQNNTMHFVMIWFKARTTILRIHFCTLYMVFIKKRNSNLW